jgi:uncharacterized protein (TIGR03086 family)
MDRALVGGVAVLERAVAYTLGSLAMVTPQALARPTPCRHWDLSDLLQHLHDSMAALQEAIDVGRIDSRPVPAVGDVVPVVRDQATHLLGSWANAEGAPAVCVRDSPVTAPLIAGAGAIEVTVHGWDVAQACGRAWPIPEELADELLDLAVLLIRAPDRPGRFAPPVEIPAGAGAEDRLLAFLGRRPTRWAGVWLAAL